MPHYQCPACSSRNQVRRRCGYCEAWLCERCLGGHLLGCSAVKEAARKSRRKLLAGAGLMLLAFVAGLVMLFVASRDSVRDRGGPQEQKRGRATYDQYLDLVPHRSLYPDVVRTLGPGEHVSSGGGFRTVRWDNPDGSHILAVFEGDVLVSKSQHGLRWGD